MEKSAKQKQLGLFAKYYRVAAVHLFAHKMAGKALFMLKLTAEGENMNTKQEIIQKLRRFVESVMKETLKNAAVNRVFFSSKNETNNK